MDDFDDRFKAAKSLRSGRVEEDGYDVYKFCFNGREEEWKSGKSNDEPAEIFSDVVATVAEEFSGDLFNTMFPENQPWVAYESGTAIPEEEEERALEFIKTRERKIEKSITASNFYDEGPTSFQDAVFGVPCIWIERNHIGKPITCEAVPASQVYLRLSHDGIDDRFRVQSFFYRDLPQLFPDAKFPKEIQDKIDKSKNSKAKVIRAFWKDSSDPGYRKWLQRIRVDGKEIGLDETLEGDGSCPMVVGRFNAQPGTPWARGPARRMLPTLRVLDELVRMNLESMDHTLDPAIVYPHDGILDLSEGLEAGIAYPASPGTSDNIQTIGGGQLDYGFFAEERIEERVREGFYREAPQKGKTPPSASQYMGEGQKSLRKMARPAGKLWKEFGVGVLKRFEYLETQNGGSLQDEDFLLLDGKAVTLRPISPLERAQASEDVIVAQSIMEIATEALGPEQAGLVIDGPATMNNIKETLKDKIVTFRTQDQIKQIMEDAQGQQNEEPPQETA